MVWPYTYITRDVMQGLVERVRGRGIEGRLVGDTAHIDCRMDGIRFTFL